MKRLFTILLTLVTLTTAAQNEKKGYKPIGTVWAPVSCSSPYDIDGMANGRFTVRKHTPSGDKIMFYRTNGTTLSEFMWDPAYDYRCDKDGTCAACKDGKWFIIPPDGIFLKETPYVHIGYFVDGLAVAKKTLFGSNDIDLINAKGEVVYTGNIDKIGPLINGRRLVKAGYDGYGYMDENNKIVIPAKYRFASDFSTGDALISVALVQEGWSSKDRYVIDRNGDKMPIDCSVYNSMSIWVNGRCIATRGDDEQQVIVDSNGIEAYQSGELYGAIGALAECGGSINFFYWGKDETGKSVVYTYYNSYPVPHLDEVPGIENAFDCASTNYYEGNMIGYYNLFLNTKRMIKSLRFIKPEGIPDGVSHLVYHIGESNVVEIKDVKYDLNYLKVQGDYAVVTSSDGGCYLVQMPDTVLFKIHIEEE